MEVKTDEKGKNTIICAIVGDIVGSRFEWQNRKSKRFTAVRRYNVGM